MRCFIQDKFAFVLILSFFISTWLGFIFTYGYHMGRLDILYHTAGIVRLLALQYLISVKMSLPNNCELCIFNCAVTKTWWLVIDFHVMHICTYLLCQCYVEFWKIIVGRWNEIMCTSGE